MHYHVNSTALINSDPDFALVTSYETQFFHRHLQHRFYFIQLEFFSGQPPWLLGLLTT